MAPVGEIELLDKKLRVDLFLPIMMPRVAGATRAENSNKTPAPPPATMQKTAARSLPCLTLDLLMEVYSIRLSNSRGKAQLCLLHIHEIDKEASLHCI
jgi:hypothetical protein